MKQALTLSLASLLSVAALPANAQNYRVAHFTPQTSTTAHFDQKFAQLVTDATGGKTTFEFFWGGALGSGAEIVHLLTGGAIKIGGSAPVYYPSELPISGLTNSLPTLFDDVETAMRVQRRLTTGNPLFLKEASSIGIYPLVQHGLSASHLMCTKPVSTVTDLSGLRVRTYGYFLPAAMSAIGMTPINMGTTEMYEGLERGMIDCVAVSYGTASSYKIAEVAKYWSDINLGALSGPVLYASQTTYFNDWDDTMRAIVNEASSKVFEEEISYLSTFDEEALEKAHEAGVELIHFTEQAKVNEMIPNMLDLWEERQVSTGMPADVAAEVVSAVRAELGK
ncbi:MAG: TRAP transporter substrate-binding protein DctP [Marinobacter sp.]|jgi:TRAP-type C4-dicarboxylate transport system substrate-binding protein|nr:TRAP transporter substrate-binding protein DctP [Marinobacter sp.]